MISTRAARPSSSPPPSIDIGVLLGACACAAQRAIRVIRAVQAAREAGASIDASYKDVSDPKSALTLADKRAQAVIVDSLREAFPGIAIVAEEDEDDHDFDMGDDAVFGIDGCDEPLSMAGEEGLYIPEELRCVPLKDVTVFVDPVDSTLSFFKALDLTPVQTLVGIAVNGRAVAGAIGMPFHEGAPVVRALVGSGVLGLPPMSSLLPSPESGHATTITSSARHGDPVMIAAEGVIAAEVKIPRTGAGNKLLAVAAGAADATLLSRVCSLWDTCAAESVLVALGGTVTDLCGSRIRHSSDARIENRYGVVATSSRFQKLDKRSRTHFDICREMRTVCAVDAILAESPVCMIGAEPGEVQASDVARDVNGDPLTVGWLSSNIGFDFKSYSAPEASASRRHLSDSVRLLLKPCSVLMLPESVVPSSVFYKRVVTREEEGHQATGLEPEAMAREAASRQVEARFLASAAYRDFFTAGGRVARVYNVSTRRPFYGETALSQRYSLLLEDYSPAAGWKRLGTMDGSALRAALAALADMHAFFWPNSSKGTSRSSALKGAVWERASFLAQDSPALKESIISGWSGQQSLFESSLTDLDIPSDSAITLDNLGIELAHVTPEIRERVHSVGTDETFPHRTILHGDARAANFFLRRRLSAQGRHAVDSDPDVGMIGFQWCGFGHPILDVAFLLASAAPISELSNDGLAEACSVAFYTSCLSKSLVKHGKAESEDAASGLLPLSDALDFYDDCILDISTWVVGVEWPRIKASAEVFKSREQTINCCTFSKSKEHALWLVARTAALLDKRKKMCEVAKLSDLL